MLLGRFGPGHRFRYSENVRTARQTQRDYSFKRPTYDQEHHLAGEALEHQAARRHADPLQGPGHRQDRKRRAEPGPLRGTDEGPPDFRSDANHQAEDGKQVVEQTIRAMNELSEKISASCANIEALTRYRPAACPRRFEFCSCRPRTVQAKQIAQQRFHRRALSRHG